MEKTFRILLSGSSGMIGRALLPFLKTKGHDVFCLSRSKSKKVENVIYWDPACGEIDKGQLEHFDALIHLAGENITSGRWTKSRKKKIFLSRCRDTWLLSETMSRLSHPPKIAITASAVGYFGDRGKERLTETSSQGKGFLADLCRRWELATLALEHRGVRTIHPRLGAVLSLEGGMLKKMLPLFRLGLGGRIGSGDQMISWIAIEDVVSSIYHLLKREEIQGPVNLVSPYPVEQEVFAKTLARVLGKRASLPLPAWILKLALGEMAKEVLLSSQNAYPQRLLETEYSFAYPHLEKALQYLLLKNSS